MNQDTNEVSRNLAGGGIIVAAICAVLFGVLVFGASLTPFKIGFVVLSVLTVLFFIYL